MDIYNQRVIKHRLQLVEIISQCLLTSLVISLFAVIDLASDFWWCLYFELHVVESEDLLHWDALCLDCCCTFSGFL